MIYRDKFRKTCTNLVHDIVNILIHCGSWRKFPKWLSLLSRLCIKMSFLRLSNSFDNKICDFTFYISLCILFLNCYLVIKIQQSSCVFLPWFWSVSKMHVLSQSHLLGNFSVDLWWLEEAEGLFPLLGNRLFWSFYCPGIATLVSPLQSCHTPPSNCFLSVPLNSHSNPVSPATCSPAPLTCTSLGGSGHPVTFKEEVRLLIHTHRCDKVRCASDLFLTIAERCFWIIYTYTHI